MRNILIIFISLAIIFSFVACNNNVKFTESENKTILSDDGIEYTFVGNEGYVGCFGEKEFLGHVKGEKRSFIHIATKIKTGMYSVNGNQDVLVRYLPDNEFFSIYVKSELLETKFSLDNCIRFEFVKYSDFNDAKTTMSQEGITECEQFLHEIKSGQTVEDAELYNLIRQPDGTLKNLYIYGYVCGIMQEDLNLFIPLQVMSFDDKAYSITIDDTEYVLSQEWIDKLITE